MPRHSDGRDSTGSQSRSILESVSPTGPIAIIAQALEGLQASIDDSRKVLATARVRPPHVLFEETLVRYLLAGIGDAEVAHIVASAGHPTGAEPIRRHLFEIATDVLYLVTDPAPDEMAARTVVWAILHWEQDWQLAERIVQVERNAQSGRRLPVTGPEALENFAQWLETHGGSAKPLRRLFATELLLQARPRHWSGVTRTTMLQRLEERSSADTTTFDLFWKLLASEGHVSPWWRRRRIALGDDGTLRFRDPAQATPTEIVRLATHAAGFLAVTRNAVEHYFARRDLAD